MIMGQYVQELHLQLNGIQEQLIRLLLEKTVKQQLLDRVYLEVVKIHHLELVIHQLGEVNSTIQPALVQLSEEDLLVQLQATTPLLLEEFQIPHLLISLVFREDKVM